MPVPPLAVPEKLSDFENPPFAGLVMLEVTMGSTVCLKFFQLLALKLLSPPYVAVIWLCDPTLNEEVENVAVVFPPLVESVPVPRVVAPSLKVTVPVGAPEPGGACTVPGACTVTVAVNVTDCPPTDGLGEESTVVVVSALFTVWVKFGEVLPVKLVSPV